LATVVLVVKMGERVAEADYGIVEIMHVPIQPAPIRLDRAEDVAAPMRVLECFSEHRCAAVDARDLEPGLQKLHGVIARAGSHVENFFGAVGPQLLDEELALCFRSALPVDQLVPLCDERFGVFLLVVIGFADAQRILTKTLCICSCCASHRLPYCCRTKWINARDDCAHETARRA